MAYGRKDYFWGVAPEKSVFGELQASKTHVASNLVASGATVGVAQHTLAAGLIWQITSILICADQPGINTGEIKIDTTLKCQFSFDTNLYIQLGEGGVLTLSPGEKYWVYITNTDSIGVTFRIFTSGFTQQTIV